MPLDANGIYQYEETDLVSPFSDFMNLGQSSVSTEIATLDSRITTVENNQVDNAQGLWTEFTKVSPSASMANITVEYRITGRFIEWRTEGSIATDISVPVSGDIVNQNVTIGVPADMRPEFANWTFTISMGMAVHVAITPGGNITMYAAESRGVVYNISSGASFTGQSPAYIRP